MFVHCKTFDDPGTLLAERASFDVLCSVIDLSARVKNGRADARATAPALRRALAAFAYGDSLIKPKHHLNGDIPGQ